MSIQGTTPRFDCLSKLKPGEPYFVLRAQDNLAADLVELWAIRAGTTGKCDPDKIAEAKHVVQQMRDWGHRKDPD
jgi:hypothetical protein